MYLDNASTSPLRPEALEAMLPLLKDGFGNPSGSHSIARAASRALDEARESVARILGADPGEVVFTSGATESDNLAISGTLAARPGIVVCSEAEHRAVLHPCLAASGQVVAVDGDGAVDLGRLEEALSPSVVLVSVMLVNNEVGTISPLEEVAGLLRQKAPRAVLHTDAAQAACLHDLAEEASCAHLVSVSAHKVGGPKGVGALVVRKGTKLAALHKGGGQERDLRSGTHNLPGIVGMAAALEAAERDRLAGAAPRMAALRDRLGDCLVASIDGAVESGDRSRRSPGHLHLRIPGVESEELLLLADEAGLCASAGSACASGALEQSHVLAAMGVPPKEAAGALRLSLGWATTEDDVTDAIEILPAVVARLRAE